MAIRAKLDHILTYNYLVNEKDVSDIIRGKIQIIDDFINLKNVFDNFDKMKKEVETVEENMKGAK